SKRRPTKCWAADPSPDKKQNREPAQISAPALFALAAPARPPERVSGLPKVKSQNGTAKAARPEEWARRFDFVVSGPISYTSSRARTPALGREPTDWFTSLPFLNTSRVGMLMTPN